MINAIAEVSNAIAEVSNATAEVLKSIAEMTNATAEIISVLTFTPKKIPEFSTRTIYYKIILMFIRLIVLI